MKGRTSIDRLWNGVPGGWTAVKNAFLEEYAERGLATEDAMLLIHLLQHRRDGRLPFPGVGRLAKLTGRSERTVQRALNRLERGGWLTRRPMPGRANRYDVAPMMAKISSRSPSPSVGATPSQLPLGTQSYLTFAELGLSGCNAVREFLADALCALGAEAAPIPSNEEIFAFAERTLREERRERGEWTFEVVRLANALAAEIAESWQRQVADARERYTMPTSEDGWDALTRVVKDSTTEGYLARFKNEIGNYWAARLPDEAREVAVFVTKELVRNSAERLFASGARSDVEIASPIAESIIDEHGWPIRNAAQRRYDVEIREHPLTVVDALQL